MFLQTLPWPSSIAGLGASSRLQGIWGRCTSLSMSFCVLILVCEAIEAAGACLPFVEPPLSFQPLSSWRQRALTPATACSELSAYITCFPWASQLGWQDLAVIQAGPCFQTLSVSNTGAVNFVPVFPGLLPNRVRSHLFELLSHEGIE